MFQFSSESEKTNSNVEITEEDVIILKKAFLLTKSVQRQSNRAKLHENSGYQPNLLTKEPCDGKLLTWDLVFHIDIENQLIKYILNADFVLSDIHKEAKVYQVRKKETITIDFTKLVTEQGLIVTVPKDIYSHDGEEVVMEDIVIDVLEKLKNMNKYIIQ